MGWDEAQVGSRRLGRSLDQLGHSGSGTLPLGPPTLLTHIQWSSLTLGRTHRCFPLHYFFYFCCAVFFQMLCVSIIVSTSTVQCCDALFVYVL